MNVAALWIAALSAAGFAVSTSFQHHANDGVNGNLTTAAALRMLVRRPRWVIGQALALTAFTLHSWALHLGAILLVQPVVVSGIVLAVPLRAALSRRRPTWGEVSTVAMTAAGLALFLVAADPSPTDRPMVSDPAAVTAVGAAVALAAAAWAGRRRGTARAAGLGLGAGVLFGVTGGLVKLTTDGLGTGQGLPLDLLHLVATWPAWALVLTGLSGVVLNQHAYRAGPLSASMPLLNIVDVIVAITFGVLVFGETPAHGALALTGQAAALALMALGVIRLARSGLDEREEVHTPPVREPVAPRGPDS